jgi:hypothetical protein
MTYRIRKERLEVWEVSVGDVVRPDSSDEQSRTFPPTLSLRERKLAKGVDRVRQSGQRQSEEDFARLEMGVDH